MAIDNIPTSARRTFTSQVLYKRGTPLVQTLAGAVVLTKYSSQHLKLDPGGANRDVTLPAYEDGLWFEIYNAADAAENLVVKDAAGTVATLNQNEYAKFWSDGVDWTYGGILTIAQT